MTYAVLSDIHAHAFTLFGKTDVNGSNSRLNIILREMIRAADVLKQAGGSVMIISGDILHARGQIDPEVLNPLRRTIEVILDMGIDIYAIPGNHDLKSADTHELSSSIQNLAQISLSGGAFTIFNKPTLRAIAGVNMGFVPWRNTKEDLIADLTALAAEAGANAALTDVFIHAGVDGVLSGMPAHGLTHIELGAFGFRHVFCGHYHNHKDFGNGVVSVGATTHHNWGDIGTKAGFLLVDGQSGVVSYNAAHSPQFIDISGMTEDELTLAAPGNYTRFRGPAMTDEEVKELRSELTKLGSLGVSIEVPRTTSVIRSSRPVKAVTLEQSIESFISSAPPAASVNPAKVLKRAIETLHEIQAVSE